MLYLTVSVFVYLICNVFSKSTHVQCALRATFEGVDGSIIGSGLLARGCCLRQVCESLALSLSLPRSILDFHRYLLDTTPGLRRT